MLNFCRTGYLMLEGVVSDEINARVMNYCDDHAGERVARSPSVSRGSSPLSL